jgi:hypothetical protein
MVNYILSQQEYGFHANQGTENAIFRIISEIFNSLNQKRQIRQISGIFCDLEKALECVSHEMLLNKLMYYGIKVIQHNLYKSYLSNRKQSTILKIQITIKYVRSGQSSVLGPLLFVIFINDLPKILDNMSVPILFADDTSVLISHNNPFQLNNAMYKVYAILENWFKQNLLSLNSMKTNYINFTVKNPIVKEIGNIDSIISILCTQNFLV